MKHKSIQKMYVLLVLILFLGGIMVPLQSANLILPEKDNAVHLQQIDTYYLNDVYELLIITPQEFLNDVKPLATHKEKMGIRTYIATLDEIYEQMYWKGRDPPEKIKYYIQTAIEEWGIQYVLLIGGRNRQSSNWHCPVRYVFMECDWEAEILSDLYYADIYDAEGNFSSWDSDNDGRYGEWYQGQTAQDADIDLLPDIAVGRLPCRNRLEVRWMIRKIITYETTSYEQSWFSNFVVAAGDTYPEVLDPLWKGYEGEYYGDRAIENMTEFTPIKLYTSDGTFTGQDDVINAITGGCGFVYLVGHGSPKTWGNNLPNGTAFVRGLRTTTMHKLWNREKLPICVVSGCHNLQFDVTIFRWFNKTRRNHQEYVPECWGWRMTRKIGGGSVATLGATALGYTKEDKDLFKGGINEIEVQFFKQYSQNNLTVLGDTWKAAVSWYINTYPVNWDDLALKDGWIDAQVAETWILFGDPSLQIGGYSP